MDTSRFEDLELLCVVLRLPHKSIFVATVYVPPNSPSASYERLATFIDELSSDTSFSDEILLVGDFNLPLVSWSDAEDGILLPSVTSANSYMSSFLDSIASSGLTQCNAVSNDYDRYLDLLFSSDPAGTTVRRCTAPLLPESNHHPALVLTFSFDPVLVDSSPYINCSYNFKKADFLKLNHWLSDCNWDNVLQERDINKAVKSFYDIISLCFTQCIPVKRMNLSSHCQPWLNSYVKHLKNQKSKAWKRFCSSREDCDFLAYSELRNQFVSAANESYCAYIDNLKSSLRDCPKQFWKFVNSKRKTDGYPSTLFYGSSSSNDPKVVSNLFANFFKTAFCDTNCDFNSKAFSHMTKLPPTSLELKDLIFDEFTIYNHISSLIDNFSSGPDGIPSCVLKRCDSTIVPILCYLFNLSLRSGIFPTSWKLSIITPLHKKGNKSDISNYRPVANLSCIAKLFEALVCDVLYFHCKPFLLPFQHGFIKGKSTTTNLLEFSNCCISAIESGKQVDCIFTDFSKAFDRINHNILIHKLSLLGFPNCFVDWISSYLSERTQCVHFRGVLSDYIENTSGVPQGSHLGPLLFTIYINDVYFVPTHSRILCYADDAKIFRLISNVHDCETLNSDLDAFHNWCSINLLPLNINKCTCMSFSRKRNPLLFNFLIDGHPLTRLDKVRDLGITLNSRFSFEDHINAIINKANAALGFVKRWSKEFDDPYISRLLYCSFVRPILEYASPVWSPFYDKDINRIEAVQRRFLRFALRGLPWENSLILPPYSDRLKLISLGSLESRRINSRTVLAFDILNGVINSPELLALLNISIPARSLRNHDFFQLTHHRTNYGYNEPMATMSRSFNLRFPDIDFHLSRGQIKDLLR